MTQHSQAAPEALQNSGKAEKLQAIAEVFGHDVARRFQADHPSDLPGGPVDPERLAWQRSRLIKHLRENSRPHADKIAPGSERPLQPRQTPLDKIQDRSRMDSLGGEHPAVIAHLLRAQPQAIRVAVLRDLPGATARQVMRRLR